MNTCYSFTIYLLRGISSKRANFKDHLYNMSFYKKKQVFTMYVRILWYRHNAAICYRVKSCFFWDKSLYHSRHWLFSLDPKKSCQPNISKGARLKELALSVLKEKYVEKYQYFNGYPCQNVAKYFYIFFWFRTFYAFVNFCFDKNTWIR